MIDVEDVLREELDRLVHVEPAPNWNAVVAASGLKRERRLRVGVGGAIVLVAAVLGLATPLGPALARSLSGFSAWLTGEPGTPASTSQQHAFNEANAHSWVGFPKGTQLRHLITQTVGTTRVDLFGFRSGTSAFCLRIVVQGKTRSATQHCASLPDLRLPGSPVRVVIVDYSVGKGDKTAWYGVDRMHSANLQITAGIADDSVRAVILHDNQGDHRVAARSNAFLYIAKAPEVGQRVSAISAVTGMGIVSIPFAQSPFGGMGGMAGSAAAPVVHVQRPVRGGRIGWLDRRETRGQPLTTLPKRLRAGLLGYRGGIPGHSRVVFGRVVAPDPNLPLRIAVTLNAHHAGDPVAGICTMLAGSSGGGGGCGPYPQVFDTSPISFGSSWGGSAEDVTVDGIASDQVNRLQVILMNGQQLPVPLVDNAFIVNLPRAKLPARLVAYDRKGIIVGASEPIQDFAAGNGSSPARGKAKQILAVTGAGGTHSEMLVGPSTSGGECLYVRDYVSVHEAGMTISCSGRKWNGPALNLSTDSNPTRFVGGRVRPDVTTIRLRYADGSSTTVSPKQGHVLIAIPATHLTEGHQLVAVDGVARTGKIIGRLSLRPPRRR